MKVKTIEGNIIVLDTIEHKVVYEPIPDYGSSNFYMVLENRAHEIVEQDMDNEKIFEAYVAFHGKDAYKYLLELGIITHIKI
jgi:hypothetical protein